LGQAEMLSSYARARERDINLRARTIDLFNRVCKSGAPPVQAVRSMGLRTIYDMGPIRKAVMHAGLGA